MAIAVLGLGNVLMGDDGLGPFVIQQLQASYDLPASVSIEDLGTPGLDLTPFLVDVDAVIFVDIVRASGNPGDLRVYHTEQILEHAPNPRLSPHDPGVKAALLSLKLAGLGPETATLVGVIPSSVATGPGLSEPVRAAIPAALEAIVAELSSLGVQAVRRDQAITSAPWWEAPVS